MCPLGKKGQCLLRERNEVKFDFITDESVHYPVTVLCRVMHVSTSAYYAWKKRPGQLISAEILHLHRRMKALFKQSRNIGWYSGKRMTTDLISKAMVMAYNLRSSVTVSGLS